MALSNVRWTGMKALQVMADTLPDRLGGQRLRSAYRYALKPVRDDMRQSTPIRTSALWHSTDIDIFGSADIKSMYAVVGPRRKRGVWNKQGWHAHIVEQGTKPHDIKAGPGKLMPVFTKAGFTGEFAKTIHHKGSKAFKPFSKGISANWQTVSLRVSDKVAEIMRTELKSIFNEYGKIATRGDI